MRRELAFRDIKNTRAGLALRETRSRASHRLANLLLVGMLASFCLWLVGRLAIQRGERFPTLDSECLLLTVDRTGTLNNMRNSDSYP